MSCVQTCVFSKTLLAVATEIDMILRLSSILRHLQHNAKLYSSVSTAAPASLEINEFCK